MLWILSNSAATSPSFWERTLERSCARSVTKAARWAPWALDIAASRSVTRGSEAVRESTSPAKTTAAAGAPPMTEAKDPSTASTVKPALSALENTTNAPPWYRDTTQKTMGPWKFTIARPISAPYSSWRCRIESGDPSKPERLARTTTGRLPLAALIARAVFFDERGNSVPAVQVSGPSVGGNPGRGCGRDSIPINDTGHPPRCASKTTDVSAPAIPAQRSSTLWSWSVTECINVRMSNGFLRSGLVAGEKMSPTTRNSLSATSCG